MKLSELEAAIDRRKAFWGLPDEGYVMPNSGEYRSPGKRELLRAIAEDSAARGLDPAFKAKY